MQNGIPLEDADRWTWLARLRDGATALLSDDNVRGVVMACSALKQKYRDVLRGASDRTQGVSVHFVLLDVDRETLGTRLTSREGHFMPPTMLDSQLRTLEPAGLGETNIEVVDARGGLNETQDRAVCVVGIILSS